MMNQRDYFVNGRPAVRVIRQSAILDYGMQSNHYAPPASQFLWHNQRPTEISAVVGIQVVEEYRPDVGDPIVIQEALFKGQVIQIGHIQKQVISENEAIVISDGYASQDCKIWKSLPKIMMTIFKVGQLSIQNITKIKAKFDSTLPQHKIMKITCTNSDYYLGFKGNVFNEWFLRLTWAKLMIDKRQIDQYGEWGSIISGNIFKKSQFLGQWQKRHVKITKNGLLSAKDDTSSPSLQIKDTKQIWTRFQQIKGGIFIVVKLWYGIIKEEFAIPVRQSLRWLYHILTLLKLN